LNDAIKETAEDRIVFSQFSMGQLGLYMATNQNWKYIYSAADKKEWLYDLASDPLETENRINDPDCQVHLQLLKNACMTRFLEDGYTDPIEDNDWRSFPIAELPEPDSDDGLLFQDPDDLDEQIKKLGIYERSTDFKKDAQYGLLQRLFDMAKPKG
jgi:hypothetical protein